MPDPSPAIEYDVVGVGNALVDVIGHAGDGFIAEHGLVKGSMTLVETDRAVYLYKALGGAVEMSGGSAANTICGVASLGGRAAFIGKVSDDDLGAVFGHDLRAVGVAFRPGTPDAELPTGRCIIVVTPDAERTMHTYLGVGSLLHPGDIDAATVAAGRVLYMEGYLYDRPEAKQAFRTAATIAHAHGREVSLTLSDSFCVDRHRVDFRSLVADEVDILFGNADELMALYEVDDLDAAVAAARRDCQLAVITTGAAGCLVVTADEVLRVPAVPVDQVLDTTGAGDLFAAGFLYGYTRDLPLGECAHLGAIAAAEVISHVGPRPLVELRNLLPVARRPPTVRSARSTMECLARPVAPVRTPSHPCHSIARVALGKRRWWGTYIDRMIDPRTEAQRWLAAEPDEDMRAELAALLAGPDDVVAERFTGRLQFGTAGLRAAVGAGPQRMNRLVVRQAAAGLVDHLLHTDPTPPSAA